MRIALASVLLLGIGLAACSDRDPLVPAGSPAAPVDLDVRYYDRAVYLTWALGSGWNQDAFRVYGKRRSDADYFFVAEVTNCSDGLCSYTDVNIQPNRTYDYYVAAVSPSSGLETASAYSVDIFVPEPVPPPNPGGLEVVALDDAVYLRWNTASLAADDFSFYRVYLYGAESDFLLGETDSEGFLDLLVQNGETYTYFVSAVDDQGHESTGSQTASGTPRPGYLGEFMYAHEDVPAESGFRFVGEDGWIVSGTDPDRHFRLSLNGGGWWLIPAPGVQVHEQGFETTALKCGPGSDFNCWAEDVAPAGGYTTSAIALLPQTTYFLRYPSGGGQFNYGAIRTTLLGFDQAGQALMIFDWAHQLQAGNRNLSEIVRVPGF